MPERKNLAKIDVITDCDTGMYHIGEIDGGFSEEELRNHIENHGHEKLCVQLAILQWQVWEAVRDINSKKQTGAVACG